MRLIRLLMACLVVPTSLTVGTAARAQQPPSITLGSSRQAVRRLLGAPDVIERLSQLQVEIWTYPLGTVRFDPSSGTVNGWDDPRGRLPAHVPAQGQRTAARDIVLGTTGADAIRLLGHPERVRRAGAHDQWGYPDAVLAVAIDDGRVAGWRDPRRRLPVRREQDDEALVVFGEESKAARPATPRLLVRAALRDTSADGSSAGASNAIVVEVENAGPGTAFSVAPTVTVRAGRATISSGTDPVSSLPPGQRVTREFPVTFGAADADSVVAFEVAVGDAGGADAAPSLTVRVRLTATERPQLVIERTRLDDQSGDGRLSPREIGEVEVLLRHEGPGTARGLTAGLSLGRDLFAVAGTPARFSLDPMESGGTTRLRFSVYTTVRAESASVTLVITDRSGRYAQRLPVPLRLERSAFAGGVATGNRDAADIDGDQPARGPVNDNALAVVFGIDRYRSLPAARFAARDALTMRRHLVSLFGLPDDADHLYVRADADATGAEFRKAFGPTGWLARRATPQSDIVVFYAGHGAAAPGGRPILLPWDADANYAAETGFPLDEIYQSLSRLPARSITIILDACFAGLTRSGAPLVDGHRPIVLSVEHPALLREGMAVFAAAQDAEAAGELPAAQHGLFSYWMMRGLRGDADENGDGNVSIGELQSYVVREVSREATRQDREQRPLAIARDTSRIVVRGLTGRR